MDGEGGTPPPPPNAACEQAASDGGETDSTDEDGSNCDWIGDRPKRSKTTNADYNAFELKAA